MQACDIGCTASLKMKYKKKLLGALLALHFLFNVGFHTHLFLVALPGVPLCFLAFSLKSSDFTFTLFSLCVSVLKSSNGLSSMHSFHISLSIWFFGGLSLIDLSDTSIVSDIIKEVFFWSAFYDPNLYQSCFDIMRKHH